MNEPDRRGNYATISHILERVTAGILLMVVGALIGMIVAAYRSTTRSVPVPDWQIIGVTVLLLSALALVSVVALLHTRKRQ
jgi:hypothetical protein